jgi:hypothetical protein
MAIDRKAVRQSVASSLEAQLVTASGKVQQLYRYRSGDFDNQTPVCELVSASMSASETLNFTPDYETQCALELSIFVWYADADGNTWGEEEAMDLLDDISKLTVETFATIAQSTPSSFDEIEFDTPSSIDIVNIGGVTYFRELFTITCSKSS